MQMKIIDFLNSKMIWLYPMVIVASQVLPPIYSLIIGMIFVLLGLTTRVKISFLFGAAAFGHLVWSFISQYLSDNLHSEPLMVIFGRFGLIAHILLLLAWERFQPCGNKYFRLGDMKASFKFPFIWWGFKEYIWRFTLIFCSIWLVLSVIFGFGNTPIVFLYGILFAIVNSVLEGVLGRGLIVGRIVDNIETPIKTFICFGVSIPLSKGVATACDASCSRGINIGEKQGLVISSVAFGFYHLSMGFSVLMCLAFAVGGFFMGGITIKSRGLLASIIMQFFVNMAFVSFGIIF
jgi:hypothetical protein